MLLKRIKLENFRQFYGENELQFASEKDRNITLVHGENGVGKTTILNAILWCFFEKLTPDFEQPDKLVCSTALSENKHSCRVEVTFTYGDADYVAHRTLDTKAGKSTFRIHSVEFDGNHKPLPQPRAFMNSVLPEDMAEYFFFHGEGISRINTLDAGVKFRRAIRDILGFTFAEQAVDDLKRVKARWNDKIRELSRGQQALESAISEKTHYDERRLELETEIEECDARISNLSVACEDLNSQILRFNQYDAGKVQREINAKDKEAKDTRARIRSLNVDRQSLIQKYAWAIFGSELANEGLDFIDESALKGRIPAPYDETLVKDLVEAAECICGRELNEGTPEYHRVNSLIETANTALIQQRLQKARSVADKMHGVAAEFLEVSGGIERELKVQDRRLGNLDADISELRDDLSKIPVQEIKDLQQRESSLRSEKDKSIERKGGKKTELQGVQDSLKSAARVINKEATNDRRLLRLQACEQVIDAMVDRCKRRLEDYETEARDSIQSNVNAILERFSRKDYLVELTESFDFRLVKRTGEVVAKSKGENLLLNLAFVSALIRLAQEREANDEDFLVGGTVAPFVIDAPFGELDETYKAATADFLPDNSDQLVLLLSSSHWKGTVDESIQGRIGEEYVLVSHKTGERGSKPLDEIQIRGKALQQSYYSEKRERTLIQAV